jgi:hypothetical protein
MTDSDKNVITWAWPASTTIIYNNPVYEEKYGKMFPTKKSIIFIINGNTM